MKAIIRYSYILVLVTIFACNNEQEVKNNPVTSTELSSSSKVLYTGQSVYAKALSQTDNIVGFSSQKEHSLADEQFTPISIGEGLSNSLKSANSSGLRVKINGYEFNGLTLRSTSASTKSAQISSWYGKNVTFVYEQKSQLKSGLSENLSDTISMYIPELVEITSPLIQKSEELYPYCFYKGFELHWNQDKLNKNGLVVFVEWYGTTTTGKEDKYVRNIDIIEQDNGSAILNEKLFDGIPDKALTYITLLRGNVELTMFNNQTYRTLGESHTILPMFLVREIKQ